MYRGKKFPCFHVKKKQSYDCPQTHVPINFFFHPFPQAQTSAWVKEGNMLLKRAISSGTISAIEKRYSLQLAGICRSQHSVSVEQTARK
jgi:hypothetical protein